MTVLARSCAGTEAKHPLNDPIGVLLAATMTTSATIFSAVKNDGVSTDRLTLGF